MMFFSCGLSDSSAAANSRFASSADRYFVLAFLNLRRGTFLNGIGVSTGNIPLPTEFERPAEYDPDFFDRRRGEPGGNLFGKPLGDRLRRDFVQPVLSPLRYEVDPHHRFRVAGAALIGLGVFKVLRGQVDA